MTTAYEPAPAQGGGTFGRWRRGRPFWGGLFLILSAIELFFSSNLNPSDFQVHFGPTGFLSYVIPAMLLLCGGLTWLSPGQRLFYGILGTLTAVYSLIGLNLGGFFLGLVLGCVGGALTVAWSPQRPPVPDEPAAPEYVDELPIGQRSTAVYGTPNPEAELGWEAEPNPDAELGWEGEPSAPEIEAEPGPRHGLLTDTLPTSLRSPLQPDPDDEYGARHSAGPTGGGASGLAGGGASGLAGGGAGSAEDERPPDGGSLPRRRMRYAGGAFAILMVVAVAAGAVNQPLPASAAPCPTSSKASPAKTTGSPAAPNAAAAPKAPSPSASASPTAQAGDSGGGGGIIEGIVDFFSGLFGGKKADPEPSASPSPSDSPSAAATGAPAGSGSPAPTKSSSSKPCGASASASVSVPPKRAALAAGQPAVAPQPSLLLAGVQTMSRLSYDGIVDLPTKSGTIRVLKFSMRESVSRPFELRTPGGPKLLETKSTELTVSGNVAFYTNKFSGKVLGVIPQTYTPDSPPLLIVPEVLFTDVEINLVFIQADVLTADSLDLRYAT